MYTNDELLKRRTALSAAQVARLRQRIQQGTSRQSAAATIPARSSALSAPLSSPQQRLWFLQHLEPESSAYNEIIALRLYGELDYAALQGALAQLAARHEILRTTFPLHAGAITQVISPANEITPDLPLIDLQALAYSERAPTALCHVEKVQQLPFRLANGFAWRTCLLRIDTQEHIFCACLHHILVDAWSLEIFTRELMTLYNTLHAGQPAELPTLPLQYGDYAAWQQQSLSSGALQEHAKHWLQRLSGPLPPLELPTDYPRPPLISYHGARQYWTLPATLYRALSRFCIQERITTFTLLLSAFAVLLARYARQEEVMIGAPVAGRDLPELETLLGCFINTLALRLDLSGEPSWREVLRRVHAEVLAASEHQSFPFEKVVELLRSERDTGRHALFQTLFTLQNVPQTSNDLADLTVLPIEVEVKTAKIDLSLVLRESSQGLSGYLEYTTDLFSAHSMALLLRRYQHLLEELVARPDTRVSDISLLLPEERAMLPLRHSVSWPERHFLAAFARQVKRVPEALALSDEYERLSYRALDDRSRRLAASLQRQGIGPETRVGVYTRRGVTWATALLALFKASGVYLPLNPRHPAGRLRALLARNVCRYLLTTRDLYPSLCTLLGTTEIQVFCLEDLLLNEDGETWHEPAYEVDQLAYIIYTSGSTGEPKGAMLHHAGMLNHLYAKAEALELHEGDCIAQTASQSFDISLWQLLASWLVGGQTRIYSHELVADPPRLCERLAQEAVTILEVVPSWLSTLLEVQAETSVRPNLSGLRWLIPTGEALTANLCARWLQTYPHIPLLNAYGPTECSDDVTHYAIRALSAEQQAGGVIPIGAPLPNLSLSVLDDHMQLLPPGVRGEIYVGGIGVGRGYLDDPLKTALAFVPDPWSAVAGARLYRTGDLGCYNQQGQLLFHGRVDQQVKLRGYRIELGEIEQALRSQPGVKECVVLVHEIEAGEQQLVGYVVGETGVALVQQELLRAASEALPEYMVPTALVLLESLPLTAHGKVDRQALARLGHPTLTHNSTEYIAPGNFLEVQMAAIWCDLLAVPRASIHDNFFALGGHSLLAVSLLARVEQHFGARLTLATFFAGPTIASLARAVGDQWQSTEEALPPLEQVPHEQEIPLSFTQMRQWLLEQLHRGKQLYHMLGAVYLRGKLHVPTLTRGLHEVIARHEVLRTALVPGATGEPWQVIAPACTLVPREIDLREETSEDQKAAVHRLIADEQQRPFDLASAPLLRVTVIRLSANEHILLLTSHQMLFDGWSIEVFLSELGTLYMAFLEQKASPLPPLPLQYADYAIWQRRMLQGKRLELLLKYWRARLARLSTLALPTIRPRPTTPIFHAASLPVTLPYDLAYNLLSLSKHEGVSLYMTLLAAFQAILARYSRQTDIVVGSPTAGRGHIQLEPLIGNFLNTLVLRSDLSGQPTFRALLQQVQQTVAGAYAHQDLPFEQLLKQLGIERDLTRNPLFQVLFAFENYPRQQIALPGLSASFLEIGSETTTFDLDLTMWEEHGSLVGTWKYNAYLFEPALLQRMRDDFIALLTLVVSHPDQPIADLPTDETALPLPAPAAPNDVSPEASYVAPRDGLEEQLTAIWCDLLGLPRVGVASDFFALGGHSLLAVRLMTRIEQQIGRRLPLAIIFQHRTIATLADVLRRHVAASPWSLMLEMREPAVDLLAEAMREMETFAPLSSVPPFSEPHTLLLTGATGFVGSFLLGELLEKTSARIICLVRATSREEGAHRILHALQGARLWRPAFQERITALPGDLTQPRLGLNEADYAHLAAHIEAIYHNGAFVNMLYPYEELKATNVQGTRAILDLASTGRIKPVHYISTLGIFPHTGKTDIQYVGEESALDDYHEYVPGGYAQSKWVAEKLVTLARERGLPVTVYRPGRVTGHSQTGAWHANDMLYRMLGGCIQLGMGPLLADDESLEMVPVDYVCQAIVELSRRATSQGQVFHLAQPLPTRTNELLAWIKAYGYPLQTVEYRAWLATLARARTDGEKNMLAPFVELLPEPSFTTAADGPQYTVIIKAECTRTALATSGISCPPIDLALLHRYLASMVNNGTLEAPH